MAVDRALLRRLVRARDLARSRFDAAISVDQLAREAGLSRAHFLRSFRSTFGQTPHAFIIDLRIETARRELARGASVTEACMRVGFSSVGSFSSLFRARVGESPRAWQRRVRTLVASPGLWPSVWIPGCYLSMYT
ncbi:MAG TPA: AraC family transcriptional regulator [Kofleriaceae bacterium]|nr:AraC family transcriptional regulator [Kofleriaceae bacterium]